MQLMDINGFMESVTIIRIYLFIPYGIDRPFARALKTKICFGHSRS